MIVTDHFLFLHLHKSGGTFVNRWLFDHFPGARRLGYHLPRQEIPSGFGHLPIIGTVRNPWSYYVSWFSFQSGKRQSNALFRLMSGDGQLGFDETIRNVLRLGEDEALLQRLVRLLPNDHTNRGLSLPAPKAMLMRGSGLGFYSFLHGYMYDGEPPASVVRMEEMRSKLPALIEAVGGAVSDEARKAITSAPAARESDHGHYTEYYDDALRDLVASRDAAVIERYGYRFGE